MSVALRLLQPRVLQNGALRAVLAGTAVGLIGAGLHAGAIAQETGAPGFRPRPYVGIGVGVSRLEPKSRADLLEVADENDAGVSLLAGYDITRWLSGELYFADLGAAGIEFNGTDVGDVDYQVYGLNAIGYLFNSRSGFGLGGRDDIGLGLREGFSLYLSLGIGGLRNDSDLAYRKDYTTHVSFGGGLEYGFRNGFALRADLTSYDTDAQYASLSVLKRFGAVNGGRGKSLAPVAAAPAAVAAPKTASAAAPEVADEPLMFRPIVSPYTYFAFDRAELTPQALAALDVLVEKVRDTAFLLRVEGHTDWIGAERYNVGLSERRAAVVRDYLVTRGIDPARLETRAFGETRPISTNLTDEGRAQNRRTEVVLHRGGA